MTDLASIREYLLAGRNADGGWGYVRGKASRLEPTCCALLALGATPDSASTLTAWPERDGLLLERAAGHQNYAFHALGLLTLGTLQANHQSGNGRLLMGLQQVGGLRVPPFIFVRQNTLLQGWSWIRQTVTWIEPTAWSVLALKRTRTLQWGRVDEARLRESEAVLFDRVCSTGGWNYGNSNAYGRELHAYVPTTAVGLLALQDRAEDPAVQRSVAFLEEHATWECSSYALGLAAIALRLYGRDVSRVRGLLERQVPITCDLGQQLGIAIALLALEERNADAAFRL
jgi:hypothetical protein